MIYLGLSDDEYDEEGPPMPIEHMGSTLATHGSSDEERELPTRTVRTVTPIKHEQSSAVSVITPRIVRAKSTELSPQIEAIAPIEFADARQIADSVMANQPVIVNLQTASRELKRRMIDFCSGVTYALGGDMERVANNVFLITPSEIEGSADVRRRA
jgi:cell division inhibitor SepF